jgi:hypothetical protein
MLGVRHLALITTLALAAPVATLHAQQPWNGPYAPRFSGVAQDEGYRLGLEAGLSDRRRGDAFNFTNESAYRHGDFGYRSEYGSRDRYREDFRTGFAAGYREGYGYVGIRGEYGSTRPSRAYSYGAREPVRDLAFDTGYNDGYAEGLNDGRKRHTNEPYAESRYRDADHGYVGSYGPRETYKLNYRQAFAQGYERGFTDGWSYR